jgi:hypothetical protein
MWIVKCTIFPYDGMQEVFSRIYAMFVWGENSSGGGSNRKNAIPYLAMLQQFFNEISYTSVVEYGCGNWELMKWITIPNHIHYLGVDIVHSVVSANIAKYEKENVHFLEFQSFAEAIRLNGAVLIVKDVFRH